MTFRRLAASTYLGSPGHGELNNLTSGTPAVADGAKVGGPNAGSFFVCFGEDATTSNTNRANSALGENTDYLDNIVNGNIPVVIDAEATTGGATQDVALTGSVFVGVSGISNTQEERDRLIKVVDQTTGDELIDSSGNKIECSLIHDGAAANVMGTASGFYTDPTIRFSPSIPAATNYRLFYAVRSSLKEAVLDLTTIDAFTRQVINGSHVSSAALVGHLASLTGRHAAGAIDYAGGASWPAGSDPTNPAVTLEVQVDKILTQLAAQATGDEGALRLGAFQYSGTSTSLTTGTIRSQLNELADELAGLAADNLFTGNNTITNSTGLTIDGDGGAFVVDASDEGVYFDVGGITKFFEVNDGAGGSNLTLLRAGTDDGPGLGTDGLAFYFNVTEDDDYTGRIIAHRNPSSPTTGSGSDVSFIFRAMDGRPQTGVTTNNNGGLISIQTGAKGTGGSAADARGFAGEALFGEFQVRHGALSSADAWMRQWAETFALADGAGPTKVMNLPMHANYTAFLLEVLIVSIETGSGGSVSHSAKRQMFALRRSGVGGNSIASSDSDEAEDYTGAGPTATITFPGGDGSVDINITGGDTTGASTVGTVYARLYSGPAGFP